MTADTTSKPDIKEFAIAIGAVAVVASMCYPATQWIGFRSVSLILLLTVSLLSLRLSLWPVFAAALTSALIWDYFFIPPRFTFTIGETEDALLLLMYFVVALVNGVYNSRIRVYDRMQRQKEDREHAIKLYNTLFNSLSHELRTPIATILGATDVLQEQNDHLQTSQKQALISEISEATLRLNQQVDNLLHMSRLESGFIKPRKEWCDLNDLVYNVLAKLKTALGTRQINVNLPDNFPFVQLDYGLTEQVLHNILLNAAKYTPTESVIGIKADIKKQTNAHFDHDNIVKDTETNILCISIFDNGPGISVEELELVFDKFYRPQASQTGGTGLGLYIVRGFIEAQGGNISVLNRHKGGASFIIEIPTTTLTQTVHHA